MWRAGIKATVPYLVAWSDVLTFVNEVLVAPSAVRYGLITWNTPYQLPAIGSGHPRAAADLLPGIRHPAYGGARAELGYWPGPTAGLTPGDYFTEAIVTLQFETITYTQQSSDDPYNLNQLDPENPITACEQSVEMSGRSAQRRARDGSTRPAAIPSRATSRSPRPRPSWCSTSRAFPICPGTGSLPTWAKRTPMRCSAPLVGALILDGMTTRTPGHRRHDAAERCTQIRLQPAGRRGGGR